MMFSAQRSGRFQRPDRWQIPAPATPPMKTQILEA